MLCAIELIVEWSNITDNWMDGAATVQQHHGCPATSKRRWPYKRSGGDLLVPMRFALLWSCYGGSRKHLWALASCFDGCRDRVGHRFQQHHGQLDSASRQRTIMGPHAWTAKVCPRLQAQRPRRHHAVNGPDSMTARGSWTLCRAFHR